MTRLIWDRVGTRVYETGLDQGVLYLPDGSAVPWNGLTSVIEQFNKESSPVYYDGMKISDFVVLGEFSASMKAVTFPDKFIEFEGLSSSRRGLVLGDQRPQTFGLCYRTKVGNDLDGDSNGYKIHIIYNVTAIPSEKTYASITSSPSLVEFEWKITAVPEEVPGFLPTAHLIFDSTEIDPWLLEDLESMLYGGTYAVAVLLPMQELINYLNEWYRVKIIDNGDGTWTAISKRDGFISIDTDERLFTITHINAIYLDDVTFRISDTLDVADVPQMLITNNFDGTWTATTDNEGLIIMLDETTFEIRNANAEFLDETTYLISDNIDVH